VLKGNRDVSKGRGQRREGRGNGNGGMEVVAMDPTKFGRKLTPMRDNNNNNKNLCGRDGRTICGPQCVPKSTSVTLAIDEKTLPMATITGRTDRRTDRQSATQYAAPS